MAARATKATARAGLRPRDGLRIPPPAGEIGVSGDTESHRKRRTALQTADCSPRARRLLICCSVCEMRRTSPKLAGRAADLERPQLVGDAVDAGPEMPPVRAERKIEELSRPLLRP